MLTLTNGVKGVVDKTRHLFLYGQTRLHLDEVENLGHFLEFEVCLREDQTVDQGQEIAEDLMAKFGLDEKDLIVGAYMDKLLANK
jgi:adenylate cyclase class IV